MLSSHCREFCSILFCSILLRPALWMRQHHQERWPLTRDGEGDVAAQTVPLLFTGRPLLPALYSGSECGERCQHLSIRHLAECSHRTAGCCRPEARGETGKQPPPPPPPRSLARSLSLTHTHTPTDCSLTHTRVSKENKLE